MYRVNEIFYSLQGEGRWTGTPMVFLRFSGCNLACPFCDTDFASFTSMDADGILSEIESVGGECRTICITGGEPSLQLDSDLVKKLKSKGYRLHIETNGTRPLPDGIDWVTCSPKSDWISGNAASLALSHANELKVVYTGQDVAKWLDFDAEFHYLQPCSCSNTREVMEYVLKHEGWGLSVQIHKYLKFR